MTSANALNISAQGMQYFDGVNTFSGLDGITSGYVLTSNGTGIAPSFQSGPVSVFYLPVLTGSVSSGTVAYTNQGGRYTQVGNLLCVTFELLGTVTGVPSGDVQVSVPFAGLGSPSYFGTGIVIISGVSYPVTVRVGTSTTSIFYNMTLGSTIQLVTGSFNIQCSIVYAIA